MANEFGRGSVYNARAQASEQIDQGLRSYMLRIYNYMTTGLVLTRAVSYLVANTPVLLQLFYAQNAPGQVAPTSLAWIQMLAPLAIVLVLSFRLNRMQSLTGPFQIGHKRKRPRC